MFVSEIEASNAATLFNVLEELLLKSVVICYTGGGDSGDAFVDSWEARLDGPYIVQSVATKPDYASHAIPMQDWSYVRGERVSQQVTISLEQAAIRVAMSAVGYRHAGWENHDGGEGNVTFDVQTRSIRVEHRTFIQSYEDDTFTLGLRERKERQELYVSAVDDEDFGDDESETDGPPAVAGA